MIASELKTYIGIDVGGTNSRFALIDGDGRIIERKRQPTEINLGRERFLERFFSGIDGMRREAAAVGREVCAIGAGVPGLISGEGLIYSSVNLTPIEGLNLRDLICEATGLPAVVVNDANASAWGEKRYGAGRPFGSLLMFTLGTGVGSGLVLDGKLWTGIDGVAGEYGHATVEPEGIPCTCGNRGCLEQYASASALVAAAVKALGKGENGALAELSPAGITTERIAAAAAKGDPLAGALFERAGRYLGIAAAAAVNLLNLEAIILGGGVSASFDLLAEPMRREIARRAFAIPAGRVKIIQCELGDDAGILGAAGFMGTDQ
ncbi:MAG: hypothetical protein FD174_2433 [Geobacteraceae bacterium]|nr:MAG: hypothetical protein FD174_2433 [Geobacteraceae bacterium]